MVDWKEEFEITEEARASFEAGFNSERQKNAAIVAQLAELTRERDEARESYQLECKASDIARADNARLTEALAAAETSNLCPCGEKEARLIAAEARVRELGSMLTVANQQGEEFAVRVRELEQSRAGVMQRTERGHGLGLGDACEAEIARRKAKR